MKMKRFLAILLVLAMCLTTLGVVPAMAVEPAAEESDDAISARWTDKDSLPPADQEITPHEVEGEIPSADEVVLSSDENSLKASDIVTVIVELEGEPLADAATGELDTFVSSPAGLQLEQDLLNEQASVRAEIEARTGTAAAAAGALPRQKCVGLYGLPARPGPAVRPGRRCGPCAADARLHRRAGGRPVRAGEKGPCSAVPRLVQPAAHRHSGDAGIRPDRPVGRRLSTRRAL